MNFAFYAPNLIVAEWIIRAQRSRMNVRTPNRIFRAMLIVAICMVPVSTVLFTHSYWGPHIVARFVAPRGV
ncbi:hypothetical protein KNO81_33590 [Paraburkholderia sediminicola]|nr:hypothetical protein [Paraburkholderia sediminicola]